MEERSATSAARVADISFTQVLLIGEVNEWLLLAAADLYALLPVSPYLPAHPR